MTNAQLHGCAFEGWQCFHCGEILTTVGGAVDHFGATPDAQPGCMVRVSVGAERGLLMALRRAEQAATDLRALLREARNFVMGEYLLARIDAALGVPPATPADPQSPPPPGCSTGANS